MKIELLVTGFVICVLPYGTLLLFTVANHPFIRVSLCMVIFFVTSVQIELLVFDFVMYLLPSGSLFHRRQGTERG